MKYLAFVFPNGRICIDDELKTEEEMWRVYLGWPDPQEIEHAKIAGYKIVEVEIIIK